MLPCATRAEIENYTREVLRNKVRCDLPDCPFCEWPSSLFRRHQARPRSFFILCDVLVQVAVGLVIRWKCPGCKKTFTQQPPFALPRKRYTRETILGCAGYYVEEDTSTYRQIVVEAGMPIFHALTSSEEGLIHYKSLAHSTPYRWISSLGSFREILRRAQDLILQKNPLSDVCRGLAALEIAPQKFMTAAREGVLKRCRQLIHLEAQFRIVFGASIFPFLATRCAWG